jgi:hypothetical protein
MLAVLFPGNKRLVYAESIIYICGFTLAGIDRLVDIVPEKI